MGYLLMRTWGRAVESGCFSMLERGDVSGGGGLEIVPGPRGDWAEEEGALNAGVQSKVEHNGMGLQETNVTRLDLTTFNDWLESRIIPTRRYSYEANDQS